VHIAIFASANQRSFAEMKAGPSSSAKNLEKFSQKHAKVTAAEPQLWSAQGQQPWGFLRNGTLWDKGWTEGSVGSPNMSLAP